MFIGPVTVAQPGTDRSHGLFTLDRRHFKRFHLRPLNQRRYQDGGFESREVGGATRCSCRITLLRSLSLLKF